MRTGVRKNAGRAGIGHQGERFAFLEARDQSPDLTGAGVLMDRSQRGVDVVAGEEVLGVARVFGTDERDFPQRGEQPQ